MREAFGPLFNPALAPEARDAALTNLARKLDVVEAALADDRPYLTGPDFTVADAYLFKVLSWAPKLGVDLARWFHLGAFGRRVAARAAVQAAMTAEGLQRAA